VTRANLLCTSVRTCTPSKSFLWFVQCSGDSLVFRRRRDVITAVVSRFNVRTRSPVTHVAITVAGRYGELHRVHVWHGVHGSRVPPNTRRNAYAHARTAPWCWDTSSNDRSKNVFRGKCRSATRTANTSVVRSSENPAWLTKRNEYFRRRFRRSRLEDCSPRR